MDVGEGLPAHNLLPSSSSSISMNEINGRASSAGRGLNTSPPGRQISRCSQSHVATTNATKTSRPSKQFTAATTSEFQEIIAKIKRRASSSMSHPRMRPSMKKRLTKGRVKQKFVSTLGSVFSEEDPKQPNSPQGAVQELN